MSPGWVRHALAIVSSCALLGLYARGAWLVGFVALVPWLLALRDTKSLTRASLSALAMSIGFGLAVFAWFGEAMARFMDVPTPIGWLLLVLLSPLLQPQILCFAIVRQLAAHGAGPFIASGLATAAWLAAEWVVPKLLGDTLGHGLHPSQLLRQWADVSGAAGLSAMVLLVNAALAEAVARLRQGIRAWAPWLSLALLLPLLICAYGYGRLAQLAAMPPEPQPGIRIGLIQANLTDYERRRYELGSYRVVREVLDTHLGLSRTAIEQQGAEVLLWSETVYPTTFGQPQSEEGAAFDQELVDFVRETRVPLLFGTFARDEATPTTNGSSAHEYNVAALLDPERGLLARYRKSHPFPFTEHVPALLDWPWLRRLLPWTGRWQPGDGARVLPLRTPDGREINVVPLICLDDVKPGLALEGARLGAQAIVGLSNDAWFSHSGDGARLHLAVAAFRSIETRLPQLRVTTNGISAVIDPSGEIVVQTAVNQQAVLVGALPLLPSSTTLMLRWGDWLGGAALGLLACSLVIRLGSRNTQQGSALADMVPSPVKNLRVQLLTASQRTVIIALKAVMGIALLVLAWLVWRQGGQILGLLPLQVFVAFVLVPAVVLALLARLTRAEWTLLPGQLCTRSGTDNTAPGEHTSGWRIECRGSEYVIPFHALVAVRAWRWPLPGNGVDLELRGGKLWSYRIAIDDPSVLLTSFAEACSAQQSTASGRTSVDSLDRPEVRLRPGTASTQVGHAWHRFMAIRANARRHWLEQPWLKFALYSLLAALPAFRLHQIIAFGGSFGEFHTYGGLAWFSGLLIWWLSWAIGLCLVAAALRVLLELANLGIHWIKPMMAAAFRTGSERLARTLYYLGIPLWLLVRLLGSG